MQTFNSNGKLLLTGEYLVLDGAKALALPTVYGQSLSIEATNSKNIYWQSIDHNGKVWFECEFEINDGFSPKAPVNETAFTLTKILKSCKTINPDFLKNTSGIKVTTKLDFPNNWGLGSSSTLINNIANWANVDAYKLLALTFGGSGYDIACAQHNFPISYQLKDSDRIVKKQDFNPVFSDNLYFIYLNKKQNSRDGIAHYKLNKNDLQKEILEVNHITSKIVKCVQFEAFSKLITRHEQIIASVIQQTPVKNLYFNDFHGSIKSLGAWGGDFILVASKDNPSNYFKQKGFTTIIPYDEMILK